MKLLVSVTDAAEARLAVAGGVDIVDVKNPAEGSLGAPAPEVIERVREEVPAELPVSVALGDLPALPGTAALAAVGAARSGAAYVKVGLWGASTEDDAVAVLRASLAGGVPVIAGAYADAERVDAHPLGPRSLVAAARRAGVAGCLLDTAVKDGRGLFEWLDAEALAALVAEAHGAGLVVALAGALRAEDLPAVRDTGADIAGVRSAACRDGRRTAPIDPDRIARLRELCG
jgi:(5-formylfuran-3-yl)methyl phosphate synthase